MFDKDAVIESSDVPIDRELRSTLPSSQKLDDAGPTPEHSALPHVSAALRYLLRQRFEAIAKLSFC